MADKFDDQSFKSQTYNKDNPKVTVGKMVIGVFDKYEAYDESSAIEIHRFKDLNLSTESIGYTMENYYESNLIGVTEDNRYYFNKEEYKKFESKIFRRTYLILALPVVFMIIFYIISKLL